MMENRKVSDIAYLACPYSHPELKVKQERHATANRVVFNLMRKGILVYSPLTHNIPLEHLGIHGNFETWKAFDHGMLSRCDRLIVLKLPGWEESKGVAAEIAYATQIGKPIEWMEHQIECIDQSALSGLIMRMNNFNAERDWNKFHSPKNLAMNLAVEVGELLEHFRWLTEAQSFIESPELLRQVQDEVGDVFLTLMNLSYTLGIDLEAAAHEKLNKIAAKYPVDKCKGLSHKYTEYQ